jgi:NAD(P)-dependent dehydrogenase (short-subunit alcohol dehydrogenase family)
MSDAGKVRVSETRRGNIVVTGATTGIGAAVGNRLADLGYRVYAGVHDDEDIITVNKRGNPRVTPVLMDVTSDASIAAAAEQIGEAVGGAGLVGLVNNAGIAVGGPLELLPLDDMRKQLDVNVIGALAATQAFLPLLREGQGRIVNVGSTSGRVAAPFAGPYAASKFALRALNDALRVELSPWHLPVCLIEVGPVATDIWDKSLKELDRRWDGWSPAHRTLYRPLFRAIRKSAEARGKAGIPVEEVVSAIVHAVAAPKPRSRYIVGNIARQIAIVSLLPDRLRDWLVLRHLGI